MAKIRVLLIPVVIAFFLISCGGGGGGTSESVEVPDETADTSPDTGISPDPTCSPRGMAILALLHPKFPVDKAAQVLKSSCNPTYSFVWQTFGKDLANYIALNDALLAAGKKPSIEIYGLCGPCRKPRRDGRWEYFYPGMDIDQINYALLHDGKVRQSYRNLMHDVESMVLLYPDLNFVIVPELEDNMTEQTFSAVLAMTKEVFDQYPNVSIRRNPMHGGRRPNVSMEAHGVKSSSISHLGAGDALSFDGSDFNFVGENEARRPDFDDIKNLILECNAKDIEVFIWRPEWQGFTKTPTHPDDRNYGIEHVDQLIQLMQLP